LAQKFICKELQYIYHLILQEKTETLVPVSHIILRFSDIKILKYGDHSSIAIFRMEFPYTWGECWECFEVLEK